jgi:NAD(P)-dependent dehydrogenase (short-subunit alcohol dehydrogenase family)
MKIGTEQHTPPPQHQNRQPGIEHDMQPQPQYVRPDYHASGKLQGKVAIITGGDSGIGRAVAVHFAMEGADVAIQYLDEDIDAEETSDLVQQHGKRCLLFAGDISDPEFCERIVADTVGELGHLDILVNNAGEQFPAEHMTELDFGHLDDTFRVNCFSMFYLTRAALPHLKKGSSIINTASVTAYRGSAHLVDYSATKGAIVAFTRSLSKQLIKQGIYVNAVAPGPVWTPLIAASFTPDEVAKFGANVPMGRAGQPSEIAPCYVFLASDDTSYMTGQVLHPNGGEIING